MATIVLVLRCALIQSLVGTSRSLIAVLLCNVGLYLVECAVLRGVATGHVRDIYEQFLLVV